MSELTNKFLYIFKSVLFIDLINDSSDLLALKSADSPIKLKSAESLTVVQLDSVAVVVDSSSRSDIISISVLELNLIESKF
mgnify:CR=1 FL=1